MDVKIIERDYLDRALLVILPRHLKTYVMRRLDQANRDGRFGRQGSGTLQEALTGAGSATGTIDFDDLSTLIRILTERAPDGRSIIDCGPELRSKLHDLRHARNDFAHGGTFDRYRTMAVLTEVSDVLRLIGADRGAPEITGLIEEFAASWSRPGNTELAAAGASHQGQGQLHDTVPVPGATTAGTTHAHASERSAPGAPQQVAVTPLDAVEVELDLPPVLSYAEACAGTLPPMFVHVSLPASNRADPAVAREDSPDGSTPEQGHVVMAATCPGTAGQVGGLTLDISIESDGTPLAHSDVVGVDLLSKAITRQVELRLDRSALLQMTSQVTSTVHVTLRAGDAERAENLEGPLVLAARQWILKGRPGDVAAALATFVQPQQPEIPTLCREAAAFLERSTGSSALEGYQAGLQRVDLIVAALCRAVHGRGVAYANPPTSWGTTGQRVRTAEDVLERRLGTCLDTVVLLASALEFLDIQPLLFVLPGHALLGYWKVENHAAEQVAVGAADLVNQIDRGEIGLVETTLLTASRMPELAGLHNQARHEIGPSGSGVEFVVSVHEARERGVTPLPARGLSDEGEVVEVTYTAARRATTAVLPEELVTSRRERPHRGLAPDRVEVWKRELLDLSLRNRLINCSRSARERHSIVELAVPESLIGGFEDLINGGHEIKLRAGGERASDVRRRGGSFREELDPPVLGERIAEHQEVEVDLTTDLYDRILQKLAGDARTLVEETGANNLYLALGTLLWTTGGTEVRSPLVLIPVELVRGSTRSPFRLTIDPTGTTTPNYSLLERLSVDLGLAVPGLAEPEEDGSGIDIDAAFDAVRQTLIREQLPFHVEATAYLGIFKFGSFRLWKDLEDSWGSIERNPLVHHLIHQADQEFVDPAQGEPRPDLDALVQRLPLPADASQAAVVAEALGGRTIVVEGPPGTGKSQTITNVIVRAVADGKRVLFVAEKQAALEVVARRLEQCGIADLALNLHDRSQRATAVRQSLLRSLDVHPESDQEGVRAQQAVARTSGTVLAEYRDHLHDENAAGFSFYQARTRLLVNDDVDYALDVPFQSLAALTKTQVDALRASCAGLGQALAREDTRYIGSFQYLRAPVPDADLTSLLDAVDKLRTLHDSLDPDIRALVDTADPSSLKLVSEALGSVWFGAKDFSSISQLEWWQDANLLDSKMRSCAQIRTGVWAVYHVQALEGPLDDVRSGLVDAKNAIFGRTKRAEKALSPLARYRTGEPMPQDAGLLLNIVDELIALRQNHVDAARLYEKSMPDMWRWEQGGWSPYDPQARERVFRALDWYRQLSRIAPSPGREPTPTQALVQRLMGRSDRGALTESLAGFRAATESLRAVAPDAHISVPEVLSSEPAPGDRAARLRALQTWNDINAELVPFRAAGLDGAIREVVTKKVDPGLLPIAFERGVARASLDERGLQANFAAFDPERQRGFVRRFSDATTRGRRGLPGVLLQEALAHRDEVLGRESIRMGQLHRELVRKRGGRKIRDLIAQYGDLVTAIKPCVLVSPDSVARFFPADRQDFDIVVFDEASQITVASAVGAMGRGRSVVVCGDSQQLPPTSFAELTREEEVTDQGVVDEESVLGECVAAQVPRHWLSWHYRSQVESLIAFSNHAYYEGRLSSFPSALPPGGHEGPQGYGILFRRVDGTFHRHVGGEVTRGMLRTNPIEAQAVVEEIRSRLDVCGATAPSIGVVTFNSQQRDLIETMLRELDDPRITESLEAADGLFVKNLENVQGDERDTILFSLSFSADEKGVVPLNFGPLNKEGGERRLNVAITRARRQVILFCSFDPSELHVERSESVGLGHLREYLDLAASGTETLREKAGTAHVTDRHRDEIADALRARGLAVTTDAGLSDFRIDLVLAAEDDPDRPLVAVLLDGVHWGRRRTVFDRDALPENVLAHMMGWPAVERVWMPEWINDRDEVLDRLVTVVERARAGKKVRAVTDRPDVTPGRSHTRDVGLPMTMFGQPDGFGGGQPEVMARQGLDVPFGGSDPTVGKEARPVVVTPAVPPAEATTTVTPAAQRTGSGEEWSAEPPAQSGSGSGDRRLEPVQATRVMSVNSSDVAATNPPDPGTLSTARLPGAITEFSTWPEHLVGDQETLDRAETDDLARQQVRSVAREICACEYPIEARRFHYLICRAFGFTRMASTREEQTVHLLGDADFVTDPDGYVWPSDVAQAGLTGYRRNALDHVQIDEIHPKELRNLVLDVVRSLPDNTTDDDLVRAVFEQLGQGRHRLTRSVREKLEGILAAVRF